MNNFARVVRLALRYRLTVFGSVIGALGVALLWGGNIGAVYPFMKVAFEGKSLQQCVDGELDKTRHAIAERSDRLETLQQKYPAASAEDRPAIESEIGDIKWRLSSDRWAEWAYSGMKPYLDRYLPADPFQTLAVVTLALLLGTLLKDAFIISNNVMAARLAQLAAFDLRKRFYRRTLRLDLATFNDEGTSDLMSRFTNDMQNVSSGLESLFGRLICEPLKMIACLAGAALDFLAALALVAGRRAAGRAGHPLAGEDAQTGQSPRNGGNCPTLQHARRDLPRHQDCQGIHERAAGAEAISRSQQGLLPKGDENRPLRRPLASADREHGHPHALHGAVGRRMVDAEAGRRRCWAFP